MKKLQIIHCTITIDFLILHYILLITRIKIYNFTILTNEFQLQYKNLEKSFNSYVS